MLVTKKTHRLAARWNPTSRDLEVDCSPRFRDGDLAFLAGILKKEHLLELERRGYDLKTLRFHVDKTAAAISAHERRAGRAEK